MSRVELVRVPSPRTARLLILLYRLGRATTGELSSAASVDAKSVWSRLYKFIEKGWVRRSGVYWEVTELGKRMIAEHIELLEKLARSGGDQA